MARTMTRMSLAGGLLALFLLAFASGVAGAGVRESGTIIFVEPTPPPSNGTILRDAGGTIDFEDDSFSDTGLAVGDCVTFVVVTGDGAGTHATDLRRCEQVFVWDPTIPGLTEVDPELDVTPVRFRRTVDEDWLLCLRLSDGTDESLPAGPDLSLFLQTGAGAEPSPSTGHVFVWDSSADRLSEVDPSSDGSPVRFRFDTELWSLCLAVSPFDYTTVPLIGVGGVGQEITDFLNAAAGFGPADPQEATENLVTQVTDLDLPSGTENSLNSSLDAASKSLAKGNDAAAVNQLEAFINKVQAQRGKKISEEAADTLISAAQAIIDAIGG